MSEMHLNNEEAVHAYEARTGIHFTNIGSPNVRGGEKFILFVGSYTDKNGETASITISIPNPENGGSTGKKGSAAASADEPHATDTIVKIEWHDATGKTTAVLSGISVKFADFIAASSGDNLEARYAFWVSLLDGKVKVEGSNDNNLDLEVGAGGKATVEGGRQIDDLFVWHQKNVVFDGGKGVDTILFAATNGDQYPTPFTQQLVIDLDKGKGENPYGGSLKLKHVENVVGTPQADKITGDNHANLIGDPIDTGADIIKAKGGNDVIKLGWNGSGGQHIDGGKGVDELIFGTGQFPSALSAPKHSVLDLENPALDTGDVAHASIRNIEKFTVLNVGNATDFTFGGSKAGETVTGSEIVDRLDGRGGNDRLDGGLGNDVLTGGPGHDSFVFDSFPLSSTNIDSITDFSGDTIELNQYVFSGIGTPGKLAAKYFSGDGAAHTSDQHIVYDPASGKLSYDADGSGPTAAVQFALLTNHAHLANTDFLVA